METEIVSAIIGGVTTLGGAIIGVARWGNLSWRGKIPKEIRSMIEGQWSGEAVEKTADLARDACVYSVTWDFKVSARKVAAYSTMEYYKDNRKVVETFEVKGRFFDGRYMLLEYSSLQETMINFGTEILYLHANGRELSGRFVGFSAEGDEIITGTLKGNKL